MTNSPEQTRPTVAQRNERYARGMETLRAVSGDRATEFIDSLSDIAVDLGRYVVEFAYGDIYPRPGLTPPERQLITLGALRALGDTAPEPRPS
jgi:4-carboxymuconolactone decarboxylase